MPSSRNSAKPAPLLLKLALSITLFTCGCSPAEIEPTYKEKDISSSIKKICREEYKIDVVAKIAPGTIWVYLPLDKLLHKEYGITEDKVFDEGVMDKLRIILTSIGRVLLSADRAPEFFAVVSSDTVLGIDYTVIGNVLDIKKSYAGALPWTEANRRYVFKFELSPQAIGDQQGKHMAAYDIKMGDFLADQIAQRAAGEFQGEELKKYFKTERCDGIFNNGKFAFSYLIRQTAKPEKRIYADAGVYIIQKISDIASYCIKAYEFRDFSELEITDILTLDKFSLTKAQVLAKPSG